MKVGDKVRLLENSYTDPELGGIGVQMFAPGNTGVIVVVVEDHHPGDVYVMLDNDPEKWPYYMYPHEVELI